MRNKKTFEAPSVEIIELDPTDVVVASGEQPVKAASAMNIFKYDNEVYEDDPTD